MGTDFAFQKRKGEIVNKFSSILFGGSFVIFCCVAVFCVLVLCFPFGLFHPVIACDTKIIKLGTIDSDQDVDCRFEIKNTGNRPLSFREITPACGSGNEMLDINCSLEPLSPGETRTLTLRFHSYSCRGDVTKKVVIASDDPRVPLYSLAVSATVHFIPPPETPEPMLAPVMEEMAEN